MDPPPASQKKTLKTQTIHYIWLAVYELHLWLDFFNPHVAAPKSGHFTNVPEGDVCCDRQVCPPAEQPPTTLTSTPAPHGYCVNVYEWVVSCDKTGSTPGGQPPPLHYFNGRSFSVMGGYPNCSRLPDTMHVNGSSPAMAGVFVPGGLAPRH